MTVTLRGSTVRGHARKGGQAPDQASDQWPGRPRQIEGHVQRKARLQAASILEGRLSLPAPACPVSPDDLAAVAAALNTRPRKTLGWRTPAEVLDEYLATAA